MRTRPSSVRNEGSPDRSARRTSVLAKKPISSSVSTCVRLAIGVPTDDVVLPGVAAEQRLEGREQRHEERGALPLADASQALDETRGGSASRASRRGRSGRRAAADRSAARRRAARPELLLPVGELCLQRPALPPATAAARPRSRRTGSAAPAAATAWPGRERAVERAQFAREHARRPAVGDDVVHREEEHVLARAQTRTSVARNSGPRARWKGSRASSAATRRASPSRSAAGSRARSTTGSRTGVAGIDDLHRLPVDRGKVVRSASWRRRISLRLSSSAARSSAPVSRSASCML